MKLTPININMNAYPTAVHPFLTGAKIYDSSCSPEAEVIFIDKDDGFFLKTAPKGTLKREAVMTRYFHSKKLAPEVLTYLSDDRDWLLTTKIQGDDCTTQKYLDQPERLCDIFAERLALLHGEDFSDCPIKNHTKLYLDTMKKNKIAETYNKSHFLGCQGEQEPKVPTSPDSFGYKSAEEAWKVIEKYSHLLKTDTLLHGDYCLPNVILNNWRFNAFIDLDNAGVGDHHVDVFWGIWTLWFNLKTDKYRDRFIDAYGRNKVDEEMLRIVAGIEVFG